ncbi:hypothetical protein AFV7_gp49 [Betalipothrixvirus pezzuloense]|uniref:Uncharacterized protein n=1 Tax=Betalipothrixvirus pezzuloense TaxID=346883 RepID=A7WKR6_9VIRU|nr:hypothetical protein AFV7_gp49 [Acidianus filamentous virus 7]CAJ31669.1 conserved hypothetical protein [Acidianus filamentous virus 7]
MISHELLLTILNYLANGVITTQSSTSGAITQIAPYQIIVIMKNNNVTVSRTTVTSVNISDVITTQQSEVLTIRYSATDASPFTYTTDEIEIWASTQSALLYRIARIPLQKPLQKTEHDYLTIEYEIQIVAGASYVIPSSLAQYVDVVTFKILVSPILFFFGLFLVPSWTTALKQNPTYPQSQLLNYIDVNSFTGINAMYAGSEEVTIVSKLVGFGNNQVNLAINGQVSTPTSNVPVIVGITTPQGILVVAYSFYSGTITKYVALEIQTTYGPPTTVNQFETKTTGGSS